MASRRRGRNGQGPPTEFPVDPGWSKARFPDNAVCYMTPPEIQAIYREVFPKDPQPVFQVPQPEKALRIVGTGHSFMAPGYRTFPVICRAAGFEQPLRTHTGGGMTGSVRYKWEQENGIFGQAAAQTAGGHCHGRMGRHDVGALLCGSPRVLRLLD